MHHRATLVNQRREAAKRANSTASTAGSRPEVLEDFERQREEFVRQAALSHGALFDDSCEQ